MSHFLSDGLSTCIQKCLYIAYGEEDKYQIPSQGNKSDLSYQKSFEDNSRDCMNRSDFKTELDKDDKVITKYSSEIKDLKQKLKRHEEQIEMISNQFTETDARREVQFEEIMGEFHAASDFMCSLKTQTEKLGNEKSEVENKMENVMQQLKDQEVKVKLLTANQESDMKQLPAIKGEVENNLKSLAITVQSLKKVFNTLSLDLASFKTSNDKVVKDLLEKNDTFKKLIEQKLIKVSSRVDTIDLKNININSKTVSFTVGLSKDTSVPNGSVVKYDKVITNTGDCYNTTTGKFTCPMNGIYLFHVSVIPKGNSSAFVKLFKNSNTTIAVFSTCENMTGHSSNLVIIQLKEKDQVFLECSVYNEFYGTASVTYNTFSGFLLSAE